MKHKSKKSIIVKLCLLALILCICSGCGKDSPTQKEMEETKISTEESQKEEQTPSTEEIQSSVETEPSEETQVAEKIVEVDNVEDFLEAIQPGATIKVKPGYYNLSDYIEKIWSEQGEEWNQKHPYVELYECWDGGIEVAIQDVKDLSIFADLEGAVITELVVETRAGAVLNFEDCNNIFLHGLTMGHTQDGACDSSVISFLNTTYVYLTAMDLYGCGMYGFDAMQGSGNIYAFNDRITAEDCSWSEITEYPDYSGESQEDSVFFALDMTRLKVASFDTMVLTAKEYYILYEIIDSKSGEVSFETSDEVRSLTFEEDGRGCFWTDNEKGRPFNYEMNNEYSCAISFDDGAKATFGFYADQGGALPESGEGSMWLALYLEDVRRM